MKNVPGFIVAAKRLCRGWDFLEIRSIKFIKDFPGGGANWCRVEGVLFECAEVECDFFCSDFSLAHEVFHSVFANSPLAKIHGPWADGFCNAFAHFLAGPHTPHQPESRQHELTYTLPERLIVERCSHSYGAFQLLWADWNEQARKGIPFLNKEFGFVPGRGFVNE